MYPRVDAGPYALSPGRHLPTLRAASRTVRSGKTHQRGIPCATSPGTPSAPAGGDVVWRWAFLASEGCFSAALCRLHDDRDLYPDAFRIAARENDIVYGTLNTAILLTSSLTMFVASQRARGNQEDVALVPCGHARVRQRIPVVRASNITTISQGFSRSGLAIRN